MKSSSNQEENNNGSAIELIISDLYGGTVDTSLLVIKKPEDLKQFYSKINKTRKPGLKVPDIDFDKEMLVLFCPGKTQEAANGTTAFLKEIDGTLQFSPPKNMVKKGNQTALLQPFYLYKLPLDDRKIEL